MGSPLFLSKSALLRLPERELQDKDTSTTQLCLLKLLRITLTLSPTLFRSLMSFMRLGDITPKAMMHLVQMSRRQTVL